LVRYIQNGEEITRAEQIQFPITEEGTFSTLSFMIENNSEEPIELIFWSNDGDLKPVNYPKTLKPRETQQAKLQFSPPVDRPDSLKTKWGFREIVG